MPTHWTYDECSPESDLEQGDILQPTNELRELFKTVHPHFSDEKYLGFLIATQTCDLVLRKGQSKAGYISLSTIRPLSQVLTKVIAQVVTPAADGIFPSSEKEEARRFLDRVFNQNEQSLGLFFLHEDADSGIGESAVAMLRVTVAVKNEHYQTLVKSRVGRLKPQYQAKLGWLLGNLYNRPASPDWADFDGGKAKLKEMISQYSSIGITWIDDVLIAEANNNGISIEAKNLAALEALRPKAPIEKALEEIEKEVNKVVPYLAEETRTKIINRLKNNGRFRKLLPN